MIRLYSAQTDAVTEEIARRGFCHCRAEYIAKKYGADAPAFMQAYAWLAQSAEKIIKKPDGAELMYWAFTDEKLVTNSDNLLTLDVPIDCALLFDMRKWNRILQLNYIGSDAADEARFNKDLAMRGVTAYTAMTTSFYPDIKQRIISSWDRLLADRSAILSGTAEVPFVQAALWEIRREWII